MSKNESKNPARQVCRETVKRLFAAIVVENKLDNKEAFILWDKVAPSQFRIETDGTPKDKKSFKGTFSSILKYV